MTGKISLFLLAVLLLASACGKSNKVSIQGTFSGLEDVSVYLGRIGMNAAGQPVDTTVTDEKGRFRFTVELADKQPAFYTLTCNGQTITLLLAPGETVEVRSLGNLVNNYLVEGSEGSGRIKELNHLLLSNRRTLDSLADRYYSLDLQDTAVKSTLDQYSRQFVKQKRDMITFVVNNANSLSSVYALYQRMPNGDWFFSDERDVVYFQMVADSLSKRYPQSPNVLSLQKDVEQMQNQMTLAEMLSNAAVNDMGYPDIELPDPYGKRIKLSSLEGQVILLDFWVSTAAESRMLNAELAELYTEHHDKGFQIYQVALDEVKLAWVTAVQEQKLPWISVCDFKGLASPAVRMYNVTRLPTNVLIDRQGRIVARDIAAEKLDAEIRKLL